MNAQAQKQTSVIQMLCVQMQKGLMFVVVLVVIRAMEETAQVSCFFDFNFFILA